MIFKPKTVDYTLSPYTGLTRESWIEAGEYLLQGVFQNIKQFTDPVVMPRKETKITYPHSADAVREKKAEYFEGLARSFFIAAPLIHDNSALEATGCATIIKVMCCAPARLKILCVWELTRRYANCLRAATRSARFSRRWKRAHWLSAYGYVNLRYGILIQRRKKTALPHF